MFDETQLKDPQFRSKGVFIEGRRPEKPCKGCKSIYAIAGMDICADCFNQECSSRMLGKES